VPYIKPNKKITDKEEIITYAMQYLEKDSWLDMNGFIWNDMQYTDAPTTFILDVASRMVRTDKYRIEIQEGTGRYLIFALSKKHPVLIKLRDGVITAIFSILVGWLLFQLNNQEQARIDTQQTKRIDSLTDSIKNLQTDINTLKKSAKNGK
jgi:hypothetical protein